MPLDGGGFLFYIYMDGEGLLIVIHIVLTLTASMLPLFYISSFQVHIQQTVRGTESKAEGGEAESFG